MNTIFIGGSRHVSRLPAEVKDRLKNVIDKRHKIIVGDANGADRAVQKYLADSAYDNVTVFCSGDTYRNNVGQWQTHYVNPSKNVKGFQFYAAKDRKMAQEADFGLMIWDGKSSGTILNVLRLIRSGKFAVLINVAEKLTINIKSAEQWEEFLSRCSPGLRADLRERSTPDEWAPTQEERQPNFLDIPKPPVSAQSISEEPESKLSKSENELKTAIDAALASADSASFLDALGNIARVRGMTKVASDTGLARESLYRAFSTTGNPEFTTVLKVMASLGLQLKASKINSDGANPY
jgi:probable addiction module antidote protein